MTCSVGSPVKQSSHGRHITASIDAKHCLKSKPKPSTNSDWRKEKTRISCNFLPPPRFFFRTILFLAGKIKRIQMLLLDFFVVRFFLHRSRSLSATNINTTTCVCLTWVSRLQVCLSCKKSIFLKAEIFGAGRSSSNYVRSSFCLSSFAILDSTDHSSQLISIFPIWGTA